MSNDFDRDPTADALRASLARNAARAPSGDLVAERIVRTAVGGDGASRRRGGWRTWVLPLVAAAAVAGVVTAMVRVENIHPEADRAPAGASSIAPAPVPVVSPSVPVPVPATPAPRDVTANTSTLRNVRVLDLTFAGEDDGWALASADCVQGSGRCTALLRTTDGTSWESIPGAAFNVPGVESCADPCVEHLRFATDQVGYAFGPDALFMTTDGGRRWTWERGLGADALESLDGNVIRVWSERASGCPGPCGIRVSTAPVGSAKWRTVSLAPSAAGIALTRDHSADYVLLTRNPASGAGAQASTLYRSLDDGRSWISVGEPCPQTIGEVDGYAVAGAPDGRVSVLCGSRQAPQHFFVATSSDAGRDFAARPGAVPRRSAERLTGDPDTVLLAAGTGLVRSGNGGRTWHRVAGITGDVTFIGFESAHVGRVVADGGRTIWTTRDAGASWRLVVLP